ncbi:MAG: gamma-glutamylcyclotransferase family protein [Beijerinckiaceae bacterium]|jgi:cation transport regulator ChaC
MPVYFAYGSNMDEAVLRTRCPGARMRGLGRLARHRFVLMPNGYASVRRGEGCDVHGVLFDLALSDVRPLDRYEDIASGLYLKAFQPVVRHGGMAIQAMIYIGNEKSGGAAPPDYMEGVIAQARKAGLPAAYVATLEKLAHRPAEAGARRPNP